MFCGNCGKTVSGDWKVCPACGNVLYAGFPGGVGGEQILFQTTGGCAPKRTGSTMNYVSMITFFVIGIVAIMVSSSVSSKNESAVFLMVGGFVMIGFGAIEFAKIKMKSNANSRVLDGRLTITETAVEGLASERQPNEIDVFVNPVMTRINIGDITSAGPDTEGVFLIVKALGKEFVFATPDAQTAGNTILAQLRSGGRMYG